MEIFTFGSGGRLQSCREYLSGISTSVERLILLPIPTTKDNIHIKGTDLPVSDIYPLIFEGTVVACYGLPSEIKNMAEELGAVVIDGLMSEEFLYENALLTAEGALGEILTSQERSLRETKIGIIGHGRIGSLLMRLLLFTGAEIRLYTRSPELRLQLGREGIETSDFNSQSDYHGLNLLVNTAPVAVFSEEMISHYEKEGLKILDLASGECFPPSPIVRKLASIPEQFYPLSAGELYGRFIEKSISEAVI